MKTRLIQAALELATDAHGEMNDKAGLPVILHPIRVMGGLAASHCEITLCAAVLHDTVEDTFVTLDHIRVELESVCGDEKMLEAIVNTVDALSRRDDETYEDFIGRVALDKYAPAIKVGDITDNLVRPAPADHLTKSLFERYMKAVVKLAGRDTAQAIADLAVAVRGGGQK